ncbi:MAG: O-antigen ligase family protein, partial [Candidatus Magasanikbacteria bacterium]|nr:O-antigen ligase family protein [Candidatus Magasanikbacteria bacterium]
MEKLKSTLNQTIYIIFLSLAIITPLLFSTQTTEIYEVPKMYFVYFASTILLTLTIAKFFIDKKIKIPTGAIVISFTIFILVQVISTLFSQDKYTSIFGYPTRLNGGLVSQFAYLVIFLIGLISLDTKKAKNLLVAIVFAAVAVSLWGIPSHFGADPSCFVLTGKLTSACWQKEFDPTLRIFSTLGQPNWLASYLVLILPICMAFSLFYRQNKAKLIFLAASATILFAIILTNSRAGLLGLMASLMIFAMLAGIKTIKANIKLISALGIVFLIIAMLFGTNLTSRIKDLITSQKQVINQPTKTAKPTQSSLTSGGTESGQIRLIVWHGAIDVFKSSPLLGTGPETFVSSYYKFRPATHNQTTEWQFFYNKAHNEFLNYAANTGLLGLLSYLSFLSTLIFTIFKLKNITIVQKSVI